LGKSRKRSSWSPLVPGEDDGVGRLDERLVRVVRRHIAVIADRPVERDLPLLDNRDRAARM
jgi:hypothetical protein